MPTDDEDFLDLDVWQQSSESCALLLHGLEGSSDSTYIRGMAQCLFEAGADIVAMNQRGCGGRPNQRFESYHSGRSDDLDLVIQHLRKTYQRISVIGFSLGGNITLKYAGEKGSNTPSEIAAFIAVSTPCDLMASCQKLNQRDNWIYKTRFLNQLIQKVREKNQLFPEQAIPEARIRKVKTIQDFDDLYTAPGNGFKDAADYYAQCSSKQFVPAIQTPTLIITAENDPFLTPECIPREEAAANPHVQLLAPELGGHVGFATDWRMKQPFWHEERSLDFLRQISAF